MQALRPGIGPLSARWGPPCLLAALQLAVKVRGWPAEHARGALLTVAADPATRSPMRLAEAGPWWDTAVRPGLQRTTAEQAELDGLEHLLADCNDRALLQQEARRQLAAAGEPVTRLTVARRATRLLEAGHRQATSSTGALGAADGMAADGQAGHTGRQAPQTRRQLDHARPVLTRTRLVPAEQAG